METIQVLLLLLKSLILKRALRSWFIYVEKEILKINTAKAIASNSTPVKVLKKRLISAVLRFSKYEMIKSWRLANFPKNLKLADITLVFKKDDKSLAKNCRPVIVLPICSRLLKRLCKSKSWIMSEAVIGGVLQEQDSGTGVFLWILRNF